VIGLPDESVGEAIHAVIVLHNGWDPDAQEINQFVRDRLGPLYAPRSVQFVPVLPLTALGKVDKEALRQQARPVQAT
jgi:fatty-acyl-CoA synthase